MAYTYDDVVAAAKNAGVFDKLSEKDLSVAKTNPEYGITMTGLLKDISTAATEEQRLLATETANKMRKSYGIYSGADGSFASSDRSDIDKVLDEMVNLQPFTYDPEADPTYEAVKKTYLREGKRASANTLAQAAAASGGRPSSYAVTAANQAGNYYAAQLADQIPTLRQNAYSEYLQDYANKQNTLTALQGQDAIDYQRYTNGVTQGQAAEELALQREQTAKENALALFQVLGYATPEIAATLGIPEGMKFGDIADNNTETGDLNSSSVVPGGVLDALVNGNSESEDPTKGALEIASKIVGGIMGTQRAQGATSGNTGSTGGTDGSAGGDGTGANEPTVTNRTGDGWIQVGLKKLTYRELLESVESGEVVEKIDPAKNTATYYFVPSGKLDSRIEPQKGSNRSVALY